jgi:hypothetical protein
MAPVAAGGAAPMPAITPPGDAEAKAVRSEPISVTLGDGGSGPYKAILVGDPSLPTHTIYRPRDLAPFGKDEKPPIVLWGNGGGIRTSAMFRDSLTEVASHGYLIVAIGPARIAVPDALKEFPGFAKSSELLDGLDWAIAQDEKEGEYRGKLDTKKVAVMGQSLGGLQALEVSADPRITTTVAWNSGLFTSPLVLASCHPRGTRRAEKGARGRPPSIGRTMRSTPDRPTGTRIRQGHSRRSCSRRSTSPGQVPGGRGPESGRRG